MRSSRRAARGAIVLGVLALAAIPAGVAAAQFSARLALLQTLYVVVPLSVLLGLAAIGAARRARFQLGRSVRSEGSRLVGAGRTFAWLGLYAGVTGALALAVYGILRAAQ